VGSGLLEKFLEIRSAVAVTLFRYLEITAMSPPPRILFCYLETIDALGGARYKFLYSETSALGGTAAPLFPKRETMARSLSAPGARPGPQVHDLTALGSIVRHRRLELALRIDDAAHGCGVAPSVLSRLENGGAVGSDRLLRILAGLGLMMVVAARDETVLLQPNARAQSFKTWSDAVDHFKSYF
jgi:hypothetical protein